MYMKTQIDAIQRYDRVFQEPDDNERTTPEGTVISVKSDDAGIPPEDLINNPFGAAIRLRGKVLISRSGMAHGTSPTEFGYQIEESDGGNSSDKRDRRVSKLSSSATSPS